jgi:drug/metabolite transporter (DMT)-like permease
MNIKNEEQTGMTAKTGKTGKTDMTNLVGKDTELKKVDDLMEQKREKKEAMGTRKGGISKHTKAVGFVLLNSLGFAGMTFFVRLSGEVPTMQKVFFRNIVALFIATILLMRTEEKFHFKKETMGYVLLRCITGCAGMILNFWAIDHLALADANILNKMSPFFAMIMSILILREIPKQFEWGCIIVAFIGVAFIVKPTAGIASVPALMGLLGGLGAGTAYTFLRKATSRGERGTVVVFCFALFCTLATLPNLIFNFCPMTGEQWLCLGLAGCCAAVGQLAITAAYTLAPAKEISVFDYSQVIFASLLGILFLNEVPDAFSLIGYAIVIVTAVVKWRYALKE